MVWSNKIKMHVKQIFKLTKFLSLRESFRLFQVFNNIKMLIKWMKYIKIEIAHSKHSYNTPLKSLLSFTMQLCAYS